MISRGVAWGIGHGIDGREAARQAIQQAMEGLGATRPGAAIVLAAQEYPVGEIFAGLSGLPAGMPVWGMSTSHPFTGEGQRARSVVAAILAGPDWRIQAFWQPQFGRDSAGAGRELAQALKDAGSWKGLLLSGDGIQGDVSQALPAFTAVDLAVAGGLAAGEIHLGKTYQFGGGQWATGALSGLAMGGRLRLSTGLAQTWQDTGIHFTVTKARSVWLQSLDGAPAAEAYAQIFGNQARQWAFPPLTSLARLYPLGLEISPGRPERVVRSPLQVEVDGSFRMNSAVAEGEIAHLMVGDAQTCLDRARLAVRQALDGLAGARPVMLLVFVDLAWQLLFGARHGQLESALREETGNIPLIGAYTLGQVARLPEEPQVRFYNQALLAAAIGEA